MKVTDCWYKDTCNMQCDDTCVRFSVMNFLFKESMLPEYLWKSQKLYARKQDTSEYNKLNNIDMVDFVNKGQNLYICSKNCGNGKTTWAVKLLSRYFNKIWDTCGLECKGMFINIPTFFNDIKLSIGTSQNNAELVEKIKEAPLVVWDDIATYSMTDFEHSLLLSIIDYRIGSNKANIYTSNKIGDEAEQSLGKRLYSRVVLSSDIVIFKSTDYRGLNNG